MQKSIVKRNRVEERALVIDGPLGNKHSMDNQKNKTKNMKTIAPTPAR